jgi:hypothetical protein
MCLCFTSVYSLCNILRNALILKMQEGIEDEEKEICTKMTTGYWRERQSHTRQEQHGAKMKDVILSFIKNYNRVLKRKTITHKARTTQGEDKRCYSMCDHLMCQLSHNLAALGGSLNCNHHHGRGFPTTKLGSRMGTEAWKILHLQ